MAFTREADFETMLIKILSEHGWEREVLHNYTEQQLIQNWADILFQNNRGIDKLNDYPLTEGEMQQIVEQVVTLRTPLKLNGFINGKSVTITRDNPEDVQHFGREVSLKIYDRMEIAAGQSRYQIVRQPRFPSKSRLLNDRRGDLMLLINGMPVIHIELKKSGVPVSQAYNQIEKYAAEGVFTGIFSLVQIFVAMNPEETVYFANPGPEGKWNPAFYFHWADFNNNPINDWKVIASTLLSIPMAHQLIGFYTVADDTDGVLKVMRSYQYYAANKISDRVAKTRWEAGGQRGGFVWHTTGSGKTMTSFKSAQLIAASKDADKVVFLIDRIELGTQSLKEYRGFAEQNEEVQATENTHVLIGKLKSPDPADTLIVTSIQKMSNIREDGELNTADLSLIQSKRIVFIVDECHRSVFGENMMPRIKETFPNAIFFGFSGTPIQDENQKKGSVTATIFGNELHRYSIADGIRDGNVLGFDPYKVLTYKDADIRRVVALEKAKADTESEAIADPKKSKVYYEYMTQRPMAGKIPTDPDTMPHGVEDYIPGSQYDDNPTHHNMVVQDIRDNWQRLSHGGKFHAIFATSSIPEAIQYYRLIKSAIPAMKITALFDPNIDNSGNAPIKTDGLTEIIADYNERYGQDFKIASFARMKKDIQDRLAHKGVYQRVETTPDLQIDLLIVVDQMLTGFDSKWVNTLYMDKVMQYENIIQAFSRTNRLFGPEKPFGTIRYYRKPHTMERLIEAAVKLYSGDKPLGLFAERLDKNLEGMNFIFAQIKDLFEQAGVENFEHLPSEVVERKKFADLFKAFNDYLEAAKVQGFVWKRLVYDNDPDSDTEYHIEVALNEVTYKILAQRYKELFGPSDGAGGGEDVPYDIDGYLIAIDTEKIDVDYMNSRFEKFIKVLHQQGAGAKAIQQAANELHKTFATLTLEEQKFANIFLHDIQSGDVEPEEGKTFRDYITEYLSRAKNDQIHQVASVLCLDEDRLRAMMENHVTDANINEFGRFDALKATVDKQKAKSYFEAIEGKRIIPPKVPMKIDKLLRDFILRGGFDIEMPDTNA